MLLEREPSMNITKFEDVLREKKISKDDIAKILGKDRATIYRRFAKNGESFTVSEASKLASVLNLSADVANTIFFGE